jgi:uncharacterized protein YaiE (UPF0345 family)
VVTFYKEAVWTTYTSSVPSYILSDSSVLRSKMCSFSSVGATTASNSTFTCNAMPAMECSAGATVEGSSSNQQFHQGDNFPVEAMSTSLTLQLMGKDHAITAKETRTIYCGGCGVKLKANVNFCSNCGHKI